MSTDSPKSQLSTLCIIPTRKAAPKKMHSDANLSLLIVYMISCDLHADRSIEFVPATVLLNIFHTTVEYVFDSDLSK